jgi:bifunctional non-homologous end joining protein LigD
MTSNFPILPMKASLGSLPEGDDWAFEIKWDGYRTVVHIADGNVRLQSTAGNDVTSRWPELGGIANAINATSAILDGELLAVDADGRPRFDLVQRSGVGANDERRREAVIHIFDVLAIDSTDTTELPYLDRRQLLDQLVEPGPNWLVPAHQIGAGAALLAATREQSLEGVVAKRTTSRYFPGTRSKEWLKIKNRQLVQMVVGGFTSGEGNRASTFGSLLVGRPASSGQPDTLTFAGGVGTGFDQPTLETLSTRLRKIETDDCPFEAVPRHHRNVTWVEPVIQIQVEIAEFTNDGLVRHASFVSAVAT